jgi:uncharacterized protein (DUF2267 family)
MSSAGLDVFDKTLQTTHIWLEEIGRTVGPDRQVAWHALGAVLRTIRDRVPLGLSAHLGAQLPILVRGLYYDQWQPTGEPEKWRSLEDFLARVAAEMRNIRPVDPQDAARAVFQVLNHYVDPGQLRKVKDALPEELRKLWPDAGPLPAGKMDSAA